MKKIKLLQRAHVKLIGACEAKSETSCDDKTAAHLVKSNLAKYADKASVDAAKKEANATQKEANK